MTSFEISKPLNKLPISHVRSNASDDFIYRSCSTTPSLHLSFSLAGEKSVRALKWSSRRNSLLIHTTSPGAGWPKTDSCFSCDSGFWRVVICCAAFAILIIIILVPGYGVESFMSLASSSWQRQPFLGGTPRFEGLQRRQAPNARLAPSFSLHWHAWSDVDLPGVHLGHLRQIRHA